MAPRRIELDEVCVVRDAGEEYCIYPLDRVLTVLGKKWTLFVISVLGNAEGARFSQLLSDLRFVSSRTLTDRLQELVALGLVVRKEMPKPPRRVEYRLSRNGRELRHRLIPLLDWAIGFESAQGGEAGGPP